MESVNITGLPLPDIDVTAEEYLEYAKADLAIGTKRGLINALGNAKRSIHLMIDSLLNAYGLWARNRRASFPQKLKLLDGAGLLSLSILHTLNLERNVIEHEYRTPTENRVQETIDVARLLLLAIQRMCEYVPSECSAGWRENDLQGVVQLDSLTGILAFFKVEGPTKVTEFDGQEITMLDRFRRIEGQLIPGFQIDRAPTWQHELSIGKMGSWAPVMKPIIELANSRNTPNTSRIYDGVLYIARQIAVPYKMPKVLNMTATSSPVSDWSNINSIIQADLSQASEDPPEGCQK